jgi:hypothetical protein
VLRKGLAEGYASRARVALDNAPDVVVVPTNFALRLDADCAIAGRECRYAVRDRCTTSCFQDEFPPSVSVAPKAVGCKALINVDCLSSRCTLPATLCRAHHLSLAHYRLHPGSRAAPAPLFSSEFEAPHLFPCRRCSIKADRDAAKRDELCIPNPSVFLTTPAARCGLAATDARTPGGQKLWI